MPKRKLKPKSSHRVFSREFKIGIICRMQAGESVSALARELKMTRKDLYACGGIVCRLAAPRRCAAVAGRRRPKLPVWLRAAQV